MSKATKLHRVIVQIYPPRDDYPGQVAEGQYLFEDGTVTLTDHTGVPVRDRYGKSYSQKLEAGQDPHVIAGRLTKHFATHDAATKINSADFTEQFNIPNLELFNCISRNNLTFHFPAAVSRLPQGSGRSDGGRNRTAAHQSSYKGNSENGL